MIIDIMVLTMVTEIDIMIEDQTIETLEIIEITGTIEIIEITEITEMIGVVMDTTITGIADMERIIKIAGTHITVMTRDKIMIGTLMVGEGLMIMTHL